jgi:nicotinamidase-related amidase
VRLRQRSYYADTKREARANMTRRIVAERCCGLIIDVQGFFLTQINQRLNSKIKANAANFVRLLNYFKIPIVVTLERPVHLKGQLPKEIGRHLNGSAHTFAKSFFDLSKDTAIKGHLARLKRKQMIVAGCETDVCVLQSCLGLLYLGYEVFVVEELMFSSAANVEAAIARMRNEGVKFVSYKGLYYELIESVDGLRCQSRRGPFPEDIPDSAV